MQHICLYPFFKAHCVSLIVTQHSAKKNKYMHKSGLTTKQADVTSENGDNRHHKQKMQEYHWNNRSPF